MRSVREVFLIQGSDPLQHPELTSATRSWGLCHHLGPLQAVCRHAFPTQLSQLKAELWVASSLALSPHLHCLFPQMASSADAKMIFGRHSLGTSHPSSAPRPGSPRPAGGLSAWASSSGSQGLVVPAQQQKCHQRAV